ncbi:MAG: protein phosphatase 2C domain-containing protein [Gammaproteobacteria bacterium]|nr:protein phosphatase 2C domain-containing protein [Gammaproteobacteria bacterium]
MARHTYSFGASVRGPLHQREARANEDAWLHAKGTYGVMAVVCDGLGSRPNARVGSQAACLAVKEAVLRWSQSQGAPLRYLSNLIEVLWRLRIHPLEPSSAATTCLLVLASRSGAWVLGGVGDGLVLARTGRELCTVMGSRRAGFSNETTGLGISQGSRAWTLVQLAPTREDRMVVLATDGVSDDLIPEKLDGFCDWLVSSFGDLTPSRRWRRLAAELQAWPTPGHLDDKTLAVVHEPAASGEQSR